MKKYIAIILSLVLCVCFFSCGKETVPNDIANASGEMNSLEENTDTHSNTETENITEEASESRGEESSKDALTDSKEKETTTKTTTSHTEKSDAQTTTSPQKQKESSTKNQTVPTTQKQTEASTEKQTKQSSKIACTVQVECKSILDKKNKFKKDISLVPTDGVILAPIKVYLDDGATAYDALKKACTENGVELNEEKSAFGVYVVGIGGIDEKDCGAQSGWTYTVNGQTPNKGLSSYKIANGDSLVISYVC